MLFWRKRESVDESRGVCMRRIAEAQETQKAEKKEKKIVYDCRSSPFLCSDPLTLAMKHRRRKAIILTTCSTHSVARHQSLSPSADSRQSSFSVSGSFSSRRMHGLGFQFPVQYTVQSGSTASLASRRRTTRGLQLDTRPDVAIHHEERLHARPAQPLPQL